jgi:hypothetical protein
MPSRIPEFLLVLCVAFCAHDAQSTTEVIQRQTFSISVVWRGPNHSLRYAGCALAGCRVGAFASGDQKFFQSDLAEREATDLIASYRALVATIPSVTEHDAEFYVELSAILDGKDTWAMVYVTPDAWTPEVHRVLRLLESIEDLVQHRERLLTKYSGS